MKPTRQKFSIIILLIIISTNYIKSQVYNPFSLKFDGRTEYISVPNNSSLNNSASLTIEGWIMIDTAGNYRSIIDKYKESPSRSGYAVYIKSTRNLVFKLALSTNSSYYLQSITALTRNAWHHFACVFSGTSAKIYLDGRLDRQETLSSSTIIANSDSLYIGYNNDFSPTYNTYWHGKLDEIKIWKTALSANEIYSKMYQISTSSDTKYSDQVAYYMMDEGTGNILQDSSSKSNLGTLINSPVYDTNAAPVAYRNHALYFDGTNDFVDCGTDNTLSFKKNFTIESWVKFSNFTTYAGVISKRDTVGGIAGYSLSTKSATSKKLAFRLALSSNRNYELLTNTVFDTGFWYHIAATFDGNSIKIYVNGTLDKQVTGLNDSLISTSSNFLIGKEIYRSNEFKGQISEVRVWSRSLTATEIVSRMLSSINETDVYWTYLQAYWKMDMAKGTKDYDFSQNENTATLKNGPIWKNVTTYISDLTWLGYTNEWNNASNWNPARIPNLLTNVLIPATSYDPLLSGVGACRNMTINPDAAVVVNFGGNLTIEGDIRIKSNNSYTGSLLPNGTVTYNGRSFFERTIIKNGWHYVSSPINNASSNTFMGASLWYYDEQSALWNKVFANQTLQNMKGYDCYYSNRDVTVTFEGTFNTGAYSIPLTAVYDSHNYVGNPYPSTIDWDASNGWTKTNVHNAIYIWDASTNNYMSYVNGVGNNGGSRYIPATQAFFVLCSNVNGGTLAVNNNARRNTHFPFRSDPNDIYLRLKVTDGIFNDEATIRLNDEATEKFDKEFDAYKFLSLNESVSSIYTKGIDNSQLSVNSIPEIGNNGRVMPLFFKVGASGKFTISADFSMLQAEYDLILEDKFLNQMHDFKTGSYTFDAEILENQDRFLLHFIPVSRVFNNINDVDPVTGYSINVNDNQISISVNEHEQNPVQVTLLNIYGQVIEQKNFAKTISFNLNEKSTGYYIVTVSGEKGSISKKILIK